MRGEIKEVHEVISTQRRTSLHFRDFVLVAGRKNVFEEHPVFSELSRGEEVINFFFTFFCRGAASHLIRR